MRQSQLFTKTRKEAPKDEVSRNAELLIRAGFIHKEMAGAYAFLPMGLRTLNNIVQVIRKEMNAIGAQELQLTALQEKAVWEKTDRWADDKVDNWFKTRMKNGSEVGLAITHEEPLTQIMSEYVSSYRDLPILAYQFQTKFRNELRAKSGVMRGREFLMKDLYSFALDEKQHLELYEKAKAAYWKILKRLGISDKTHVTFASGGIFSQYSEEFQAESEAGEDTIYIDQKSGTTINKEVLNDNVLSDLKIDKRDLIEKRSIEIGNIFHLGTKFSEPLGLSYVNERGKKMPVIMGSYGLGPSRTLGAIVEILADEKGMIWPDEIAPFSIHLIPLFDKNGSVKKVADDIYDSLTKKGIEVLYDDRDASAGEKFSDADLIGIPKRYVISEKTLKERSVEVKERASGKVSMISIEAILS